MVSGLDVAQSLVGSIPIGHPRSNMSGGSLDYLYSKDSIGVGDLWAIESAMECLEKLGWEDSQAYMNLREIHEALYTLHKQHKAMADVLHDIEWCLSGDWSEETLIESLSKYELSEK